MAVAGQPSDAAPSAPVEATAPAPVEATASPPVVATASAPVDAAGAEPATEARSPAEGEAPETPAGAEGAEVPGTAAPEGAAAAAPDAAKKKRRRRRRKRKPAEGATAGGPAGEAGAQTSAEGAEGAEGEEGDEDEESGDAEGAAGGEDDASEGAAGSQAGSQAGEAKPRKRRKPDRERAAFHLGEEVLCRVTDVTDEAIWADIAGKAIGLLDRSAHSGPAPEAGVQFVSKVQSASTRGGFVILAYEPVKPIEARQSIREALEKNVTVAGWVTGVIKGGVEVDVIGVRCFAPASHVELRHHSDLSSLVGHRFDFEVTHYAQKGRDVVLSRKKMLEQGAKAERDAELAKIAPDMVCRGVVRNVLHWGAFVALPDFGNIEGVVHMSEASHDRGARLTSLFKPGDEIQVKVLRIDDKGKLWFSHKATLADPWQAVRDKYRPGSRHKGKVARITDFGAFIQLEPGVDGLCHVADLAFVEVEHPSKVVKIDDEIEVVVAHVDPDNHKISLHAAPPADEATDKPVRVQSNQLVQVVVTQVREGGIGARIVGASGRNARAFIPAGQTGTPRGTDLRKLFPIGKRLEAKVIEADPRKGETKLSIKAVKEDAERTAYREYRSQVQREAKFGTFADLFKPKAERS
ncbi:MAG: S1 RNA-binding domain-containing protein [Myxococcales bacterium]|nr:S1 RNA-binding domain-containing protein [Myxococcales bacterium]